MSDEQPELPTFESKAYLDLIEERDTALRERDEARATVDQLSNENINIHDMARECDKARAEAERFRPRAVECENISDALSVAERDGGGLVCLLHQHRSPQRAASHQGRGQVGDAALRTGPSAAAPRARHRLPLPPRPQDLERRHEMAALYGIRIVREKAGE